MNKSTESIAYCWQSGEVEIASGIPDGALGIAKGNARLLGKAISIYAVHGYRPNLYLVPGLPVATSPDERLESVNRFRALINKTLERYTLPEGVRWDGGACLVRCPDCGHEQGDTGCNTDCDICGALMPTLDRTDWPTCVFCGAPETPEGDCSAQCELSVED
jgi:ribosomal protein S27E